MINYNNKNDVLEAVKYCGLALEFAPAWGNKDRISAMEIAGKFPK